MLTSGDLLADRYRLDEPIAAGGAGQVWRAIDTVLQRQVALKVLHRQHANQPGFASRFRAEARTMAALHHPGVAEVYDYGEPGDDHLAYLVMAYIDGRPLSERLAEGALDPAETMSIVARTARALDAVHHAGIVHRDVKPGNIICCSDGSVVLVDFGIAQSPESMELTDAREVIGTAPYISPEQVSKRPVTPATDVYSLGAVGYHCLAGQPPFTGDNPLAVALQHLSDEPPPLPDSVPAHAREVIMKALAKDPADRYATAAALAEAAEATNAEAAQTTNAEAAETTNTVALPVADPMAEPLMEHVAEEQPRRRLRPALLAAAGVLAASAIIAMLAWSSSPADSPSIDQPVPSTSTRTTPARNGGDNGGPGSNPTAGPTVTPSATPGATTPPAATPTAPQETQPQETQPPTQTQPEPTQPAATSPPAITASP